MKPLYFVLLFLLLAFPVSGWYFEEYNTFTENFDFVLGYLNLTNDNFELQHGLEISGNIIGKNIFGDNFYQSGTDISDLYVNRTGDTMTGNLDNIGYNGTFEWVIAKVNSSSLQNTPVQCTDGYYIAKYNGTHSVCIRAWRTDGENVTGDYGIIGNVGIGTTSPDTQLHIKNFNAQSILRLERDYTVVPDNGLYGSIEFEGQDASVAYAAAGIRAKIFAIAEGVSGETALVFSTADYGGGGVGVNATHERMRIMNTGNVGIGTFSPNTPLEVVGWIRSTSGTNYSNFAQGATNALISWNLGRLDFRFGSGTSSAQNVMVIEDTGNVGIGTSSPDANLEIENSNNPVIYLKDTTNNNILRLTAQDNKARIGVDLNYPLYFMTGGIADANIRMTILGNGSVGIGTTSPTAKLHIYTVTGGEDLLFLRDQINTADLTIDSPTGALMEIRAGVGDHLQLSSNATANQGIRIRNDGNVGIGNTSPNHKLSVNGDGYFDGNLTATGNITSGKGSIIIDGIAGVIYMNNGWQVKSNTNGNSFSINNGNDVLFIDNTNDFVGIGTITPGQKLTVIGDTNITGNFTGNNIIGEMYLHEGNLSTTVLTQNVPANVSGLSEGINNGFNYNDPYLEAQVSGVYLVKYGISFADGPNNEYLFEVAVNGVDSGKCDSERKLGASADVGNTGMPCFIRLNKADQVTLMVTNKDSGSNTDIRDAGFILMRVTD